MYRKNKTLKYINKDNIQTKQDHEQNKIMNKNKHQFIYCQNRQTNKNKSKKQYNKYINIYYKTHNNNLKFI